MTHRYAEVLRWIADGEVVQHRLPNSEASEWSDFCLDDDACRRLIKGTLNSLWEFRLKPRTVKIGSREVEAPVLEPGDRQMVWCWDSEFNKPEQLYADGGVAEPQFKLGLCFATEEACRAAHDAIHALLRGEA